MAGQGLLAEPLNVVVVHVLEEIPGLVMGAGMGGAKPDIFGKVLGRFGDTAIAGTDAAGRLAQPGFGFHSLRLAGLDPDVAFETRGARLNH